MKNSTIRQILLNEVTFSFIKKYKFRGFLKLIKMVEDEKNTFQAIGDEFGVSRERVRQWVRDFELKKVFGFSSPRDRRNNYEAKQKVLRAERKFKLTPWEKKILKEAEEQDLDWIPNYLYEAGRIEHRSFCINKRPCILRVTHKMDRIKGSLTAYARYRVNLIRHPEARFLVLWVSQLKRVAIIPTSILKDKANIHFRLSHTVPDSICDWSDYLGAWNLLKEKRRKTA